MKRILFVIFFVFLLNTSVYADYMVQLKTGTKMPTDIEFTVVSEKLRMYSTSEENAFYLYNTGIAEYIEKEQELSVVDISYDDTYYGLQSYISTLGIDKLKNTAGVTGDVRIAIIDTGVNKTHLDFVGTKFETGYNYVESNEDTSDLDNHGTRVAGMMAAQENNTRGIVGVAPNATYIPYVVLSQESSSTTYLVSAIFDAVDVKKCKLINISLTTARTSIMIQQAIDYATQKGVIIFAASGNYGQSDDGYNYYYPASCDNVISVGSVDRNLAESTFTQKNDAVIVSGVGERVYLPNIYGTYSYSSGTSFSSPLVCGIVALIASYYPDITYDDVLEMIKATTMDTGESGKDYMGYGVLNAMECFNYMKDLNSVYISPVYELADGSYNIKLESDTNTSATLVVARYVEGKIISYDIKTIDFLDNIYCENIAKKGSVDEVIKIFALDSIDNLKSLSLAKTIN